MGAISDGYMAGSPGKSPEVTAGDKRLEFHSVVHLTANEKSHSLLNLGLTSTYVI